MMDKHIDKATIHFQKLLQDQLERVDRMKTREEQTDFEALDPIIIGIIQSSGLIEIAMDIPTQIIALINCR